MVNKVTIIQALTPFLTKLDEKLHLAHISREINQPHPTVRLWLNELEKQGVLKKEQKGRLTLYSLNTENQNIIDYLTIAEKQKIIKYSEKQPVLSEIIHFIQKEFGSDCIIFGSSTENFNNAKDIDILMIGKQDTKKLNELGNRLNKHFHIINLPNIEKVSKALKSEIIKKHLIISGTEGFLRWMLWQP